MLVRLEYEIAIDAMYLLTNLLEQQPTLGYDTHLLACIGRYSFR